MTSWYGITGLNPEPWQASEGSIGRKSGKLIVMFHKPLQLRSYQEALKEMFVQQNTEIEILNIPLDITFFFWRELAQFDKGKKKSRAHYADATNLMKSTEDALQGILYKNDRIIRSSKSIIMSQDQDTTPGILICVGKFTYTDLVLPALRMTEFINNQLLTIDIPDRRDVKDVF